MKATFPENEKLGSLVKIGAIWSLLLIIGRQLISLLGTSVLSRILTPEDYGLIGMVTTVTALFMVFSDLGLTTTVIQKRNISNQQLHNLYWINIFFGLLLWLLIAIFSPYIASFYGRNELILVSIISGSIFFISALSAQPLAILRKRIDAKEITRIELISLLTGVSFGILSAFVGLGYWSLVIQTLAREIIKTSLVLYKYNYRPGKLKLDRSTLPLIYFGLSLTVNGMIIYFSRNLDSVLIGKYWGAFELGNYNRAYFLMLLPSMLANGVASNLMVPALSAVSNNVIIFGSSYRKALFMVCLIGCPISLGLGLTAYESVNFIYGDGWDKVVILIQYLTLASFTQPIYNTTGWLFTASGNAKKYLYNTFFNVIVLGIGFFYFIPKSIEYSAIAYSLIASFPVLFFSIYYAHKVCFISLKASIVVISPIIISSIIMLVIVTLINNYFSFHNLIFALLVKVGIGSFSYLLGLSIFLPKDKKDFIIKQFKFKK